MALQFPCSQCGQTLKVEDRFVGAKIRCPACRAITAAPAVAATSSAPPTVVADRKSPSPSAEAAKVKRSKSEILDTFEEIEPVDFKNREREEGELDMTPMVDVTFLLLIFFMVTAAFSMQKSMEIPKPSVDNTVTESQMPEDEKGNILIRIDSDSIVWVDESEAPTEQDLRVKIREAKAGMPGSNSPPINRVLIKADEESLHEVVVMVLDACNAENMNSIKLRTVSENDY